MVFPTGIGCTKKREKNVKDGNGVSAARSRRGDGARRRPRPPARAAAGLFFVRRRKRRAARARAGRPRNARHAEKVDGKSAPRAQGHRRARFAALQEARAGSAGSAENEGTSVVREARLLGGFREGVGFFLLSPIAQGLKKHERVERFFAPPAHVRDDD